MNSDNYRVQVQSTSPTANEVRVPTNDGSRVEASSATNAHVLRTNCGTTSEILRTRSERLVASFAIAIVRVKTNVGERVAQDILDVLNDEDFDITILRAHVQHITDCEHINKQISSEAVQLYGTGK